MISRGAPSSSSCAATVAVLTGAPLCGGGVWVLALACDCGDGTEHLRGHVAWEGVDSSRQVCDVDIGRGCVQGCRCPCSAAVAGRYAWNRLLVMVLKPAE